MMAASKNITPINVALYAYGMSGKVFHAPFLKASPYYKVSAVLERTKNRSKELFPDAHIYRSPEDMLSNSAIELVVINTPNFTHYEYALKALKAGKHVVVEKPFTITAKEGTALRRLAEKNNLVLTVYHNRRFDSDFRTIKKVLKGNKLGEIVEAEFRFDRYRTHPGKKLHKETPGPGTGNLYDLGSHLIDQALMLFGWPQKIFADIGIAGAESRVENYFNIVLFYKKLRVRLHSSYFVLDTLPESVLYGTKGSFIKRKGDVQEVQLSAGTIPGTRGWGEDVQQGIMKTIKKGNVIETIIPPEAGNYGIFYDELYLAIRKGKQLPVTAGQAIQVISLIERAYKSSQQQKVILIPPLK